MGKNRDRRKKSSYEPGCIPAAMTIALMIGLYLWLIASISFPG